VSRQLRAEARAARRQTGRGRAGFTVTSRAPGPGRTGDHYRTVTVGASARETFLGLLVASVRAAGPGPGRPGLPGASPARADSESAGFGRVGLGVTVSD
jgi:hypothetical protein